MALGSASAGPFFALHLCVKQKVLIEKRVRSTISAGTLQAIHGRSISAIPGLKRPAEITGKVSLISRTNGHESFEQSVLEQIRSVRG